MKLENILNYAEAIKNNQELDKDEQEFFLDQLTSLIDDSVNYYFSVYDSNISKLNKSTSTKIYQEEVTRLDQKRRMYHNAIISNLVILDRNSEFLDCNKVYGKFSKAEEKDLKLVQTANKREEVANVVFNFVKDMIGDLIKNASYSKDFISEIKKMIK